MSAVTTTTTTTTTTTYINAECLVVSKNLPAALEDLTTLINSITLLQGFTEYFFLLYCNFYLSISDDLRERVESARKITSAAKSAYDQFRRNEAEFCRTLPTLGDSVRNILINLAKKITLIHKKDNKVASPLLLDEQLQGVINCASVALRKLTCDNWTLANNIARGLYAGSVCKRSSDLEDFTFQSQHFLPALYDINLNESNGKSIIVYPSSSSSSQTNNENDSSASQSSPTVKSLTKEAVGLGPVPFLFFWPLFRRGFVTSVVNQKAELLSSSSSSPPPKDTMQYILQCLCKGMIIPLCQMVETGSYRKVMNESGVWPPEIQSYHTPNIFPLWDNQDMMMLLGGGGCGGILGPKLSKTFMEMSSSSSSAMSITTESITMDSESDINLIAFFTYFIKRIERALHGTPHLVIAFKRCPLPSLRAEVRSVFARPVFSVRYEKTVKCVHEMMDIYQRLVEGGKWNNQDDEQQKEGEEGSSDASSSLTSSSSMSSDPFAASTATANNENKHGGSSSGNSSASFSTTAAASALSLLNSLMDLDSSSLSLPKSDESAIVDIISTTTTTATTNDAIKKKEGGKENTTATFPTISIPPVAVTQTTSSSSPPPPPMDGASLVITQETWPYQTSCGITFIAYKNISQRLMTTLESVNQFHLNMGIKPLTLFKAPDTPALPAYQGLAAFTTGATTASPSTTPSSAKSMPPKKRKREQFENSDNTTTGASTEPKKKQKKKEKTVVNGEPVTAPATPKKKKAASTDDNNMQPPPKKRIKKNTTTTTKKSDESSPPLPSITVDSPK